MKFYKKFFAVSLVFIMLFSSFVLPVSAVSDDFMNRTYIVLEKALYGLVRIIDFMLPSADWYGRWTDKEDYVPECFYEGDSEDAPEDAAWSVGYGENSLISGLDIMNGEYFLAGSLEPFKGRVPVEVINDQRVRAFAISDGGGIVVHAVIDGFGISRGDVQKIREMFENSVKDKDVVSVNVSALHQHSCIDTLGMNVPLIPALFKNTAVNLLGLDESHLIRKNQEFMANLFVKVTDAMKQAVDSMETGTLSYGNINIKEYIYDKRTPEVFDEYVHRLKFVPDNKENKETWIVSAGMHCTGLGAGPDVLSADYPYYIEQELKDDANLVFVLGAQLAITTEHDDIHKELEADPTLANEPYILYGKRIGEKIRAIDNDVELMPELNVVHKEIFVDADNPILTLAARQGILESVLVKLPLHRYQIVSEVGYMELGGKVGIIMTPGEMAPEIVLGGAETAEESWTGDSWDYLPLADMAGAENIMTFGLCNDQLGYIMPDNQYRTLFTENEEVNVVSRTSGSTICNAFADLFIDALSWKNLEEVERPEKTYYDRYVADILKSETYSLSVSEQNVLLTVYKDGEKFAYEGSADYNGMKLSFRCIEDGGKKFVVFPMFRIYLTEDSNSESIESFDDYTDVFIDTTYLKYLGVMSGFDYVCESYQDTVNNVVHRFYFNSDGIFRTETTDGSNTVSGPLTLIGEVKDKSIFSIPEGYRQLDADEFMSFIEGLSQ